MKRCAFLTLDERGDYVIDDEHAVMPLQQLGWQVDTLSWRQQEIPWCDFDAVLIRSTWDYWNDVAGFIETLEQIDRSTKLANPLELVRWNLRKTYLADLEESGVAIVPTLWVSDPDVDMLRSCLEQPGLAELVIKPQVGANGDDAFRLSINDADARLERIANRFRQRDAMIQPFLPAVQSEGEYSLFFFNGEYSHAILKIPAGSEFRSQEERGAEVQAIEPAADLLSAAAAAMAALNVEPLYARVDFVRSADSTPLIMEMELIEPSMYLRTHPDAPTTFAKAIDKRFQ